MSHSVDIHAPGQPAERRSLEADAVWVLDAGRGLLRARGETRGLPPEAELVPSEQGVLVKARAGAAVRVRVHGSEVQEALISWGDEVFLDDVRLSFVSKADRSKGRPLLLLLGLLVATGAVLSTTRATTSSSPSKPEVPPPALHASGSTCSVTGARSAEARAFDAERAALAKRERYVFDLSDGVAALPLLDEAAACFRESGRIEDARRTSTALDEWRRKLDTDYASLQLELRAALADHRVKPALRAARDLEDLLAARADHPYVEWLRGTRRDLERRDARPAKR
jgi:hypothetical protein